MIKKIFPKFIKISLLGTYMFQVVTHTPYVVINVSNP